MCDFVGQVACVIAEETVDIEGVEYVRFLRRYRYGRRFCCIATHDGLLDGGIVFGQVEDVVELVVDIGEVVMFCTGLFVARGDVCTVRQLVAHGTGER
jgi:hypothetical protein